MQKTMTPAELRQVSENCGWKTYSRSRPPVQNYTASDARHLRAQTYLETLFESTRNDVIEVNPVDVRSSSLPLFVAQAALSMYGLHSAHVLDAKRAAQSEEYTQRTLKLINNYCVGADSKTRIFIPDFRFRPVRSVERARFDTIHKAAQSVGNSAVAFSALLEVPSAQDTLPVEYQVEPGRGSLTAVAS